MLLIFTLSMLLILYASTLSAILYSAVAAGHLMSASSRSTARESSDSSSLASNTWLVAPILLFQILRALLLFLTTCLVLCCGLLSFEGGETLAIKQGGNREDKLSYSSAKCSFVSAKCTNRQQCSFVSAKCRSRQHRRTYCRMFTVSLLFQFLVITGALRSCQL